MPKYLHRNNVDISFFLFYIQPLNPPPCRPVQHAILNCISTSEPLKTTTIISFSPCKLTILNAIPISQSLCTQIGLALFMEQPQRRSVSNQIFVFWFRLIPTHDTESWRDYGEVELVPDRGNNICLHLEMKNSFLIAFMRR